MIATVTVVEVVGRSEQGATRPFLCRGDDDELYYVKGEDAGRRSLCCEWVAGNLAASFGLQVPPFTAAEVPAALVRESLRPDIRALGAGLVFASRKVEAAREITWLEAVACPNHFKARLLLFDWWVHNEDRCMCESGGNPNLLIHSSGDGPDQAWVFDFNLAFDESFSEQDFWQDHVFASAGWPEGFRARMEPELLEVYNTLDGLLPSLPAEWLYPGGDDTLAPQLDADLVRETLARAFTAPDDFWNRR